MNGVVEPQFERCCETDVYGVVKPNVNGAAEPFALR